MNALSYTGNVIGRELLTRETIYALCGGGMKVIYLEKGKSRYANDVTYLFWRTAIESQVKLQITFIPPIIKYQYDRNFLSIRALRMESRNDGDFSVKKTDIFAISPAYLDGVSFRQKRSINASNASKYYCNFSIPQFETLDT
jgi:hypothetical protein